MQATLHSLERVKERVGFKGQKAHKFLEKAYKRGIHFSDFTSKQKRVFKYKLNTGIIDVIYYAGYCILVGDNETVITCYPAPRGFNTKDFYFEKERIKNPKRYLDYFPLAS